MWKNIKLNEYLRYGGDLSKIDWSEAQSDYYDKNRGKKIVSYEDKGDKGGGDIPCFWFTFDDGTVHKYAISWIVLNVKFVLDESYFA